MRPRHGHGDALSIPKDEEGMERDHFVSCTNTLTASRDDHGGNRGIDRNNDDTGGHDVGDERELHICGEWGDREMCAIP